jgi:hypothetical protein
MAMAVKNSGGIVIVQVERIARVGSLHHAFSLGITYCALPSAIDYNRPILPAEKMGLCGKGSRSSFSLR